MISYWTPTVNQNPGQHSRIVLQPACLFSFVPHLSPCAPHLWSFLLLFCFQIVVELMGSLLPQLSKCCIRDASPPCFILFLCIYHPYRACQCFQNPFTKTGHLWSHIHIKATTTSTRTSWLKVSESIIQMRCLLKSCSYLYLVNS